MKTSDESESTTLETIIEASEDGMSRKVSTVTD